MSDNDEPTWKRARGALAPAEETIRRIRASRSDGCGHHHDAEEDDDAH